MEHHFVRQDERLGEGVRLREEACHVVGAKVEHEAEEGEGGAALQEVEAG